MYYYNKTNSFVKDRIRIIKKKTFNYYYYLYSEVVTIFILKMRIRSTTIYAENFEDFMKVYYILNIVIKRK